MVMKNALPTFNFITIFVQMQNITKQTAYEKELFYLHYIQIGRCEYNYRQLLILLNYIMSLRLWIRNFVLMIYQFLQAHFLHMVIFTDNVTEKKCAYLIIVCQKFYLHYKIASFLIACFYSDCLKNI